MHDGSAQFQLNNLYLHMTCIPSPTQRSSASLGSSRNSKRERRRTVTRVSATGWSRVYGISCSRRHDAHQLERHHPRSIQGTILSIETNFENRIYFLTITCGPEYPEKPPVLAFTNKINIPSVNQANGRVENLPQLKNWKNTTTIENLLVALKNEMTANKGLKQPGEDAYY